jgi:hypothetical protein
MLRCHSGIYLSLFAILFPLTASAQEVQILGGGFTFAHLPVNPDEPDGFCEDPPGLLFSVTSESFDGQLVTDKGAVSFVGKGNASGCAFLAPVDGVAAKFSGKFKWKTPRGVLRGKFRLLDYPTEIEGVFAASIRIRFKGGTGIFSDATGVATAEGLDFPFGGLQGDPFAAGVVAEITQGKLELE